MKRKFKSVTVVILAIVGISLISSFKKDPSVTLEADAGNDMTVKTGEEAVLDGSNSSASVSQDEKAEEILESMQKKYEESIEGIDNYVMEKENHTIFCKKAYKENGRPYFETKTRGKGMRYSGTVSASNEDLYSQFISEKKEVIYKGTDKVDGNEVHIIYADEMEVEEDLDQDPRTENVFRDIYLYIDSDKLIVRKIKYTVDFSGSNGIIHEISPIMEKRDYRDVEGMMISYESSITIEGLAMNEEERQQVKRGLEEFEQMPENQKKMAREMMGDKIEKYRRMLEEDRYEKVSKVEEIRVNTGMELKDF